MTSDDRRDALVTIVTIVTMISFLRDLLILLDRPGLWERRTGDDHNVIHLTESGVIKLRSFVLRREHELLHVDDKFVPVTRELLAVKTDTDARRAVGRLSARILEVAERFPGGGDGIDESSLPQPFWMTLDTPAMYRNVATVVDPFAGINDGAPVKVRERVLP